MWIIHNKVTFNTIIYFFRFITVLPKDCINDLHSFDYKKTYNKFYLNSLC